MSKPHAFILNSNSSVLIIIAVLTVVFFVFSPSLSNDFVNWDDDVHLLHERSVLVLTNDEKSLRFSDIFLEAINRTYIPITILSFAVEYKFLGFNPFVYHLDNLLLHLGVVGLIFWFARLCGLSAVAAGMAALIFGIHPMHVESVAWVTERKDVLYSFFYMLGLCCYAIYIKRNLQARFLILTVVFGLLSLLSKPMALSFPLVLLMCDWFFRRPLHRRMIMEKLFLSVILMPIVWMTYFWHVRIPLHKISQAILVWLWCFTFYLRKFFFPDYFTVFYRLPKPISILNPAYLIAVGIFILTISVVWRFKNNRWVCWAFAFCYASIFFLLRFDSSADLNVVADRFMYLPSLSFCMLLGVVYDGSRGFLKGNSFWYSGLEVIVLAILIFLGMKTYQQCGVWHNGIALFENQRKHEPKYISSAFVQSKLGEAYSLTDDFQQDLNLYLLCKKNHCQNEPNYATMNRVIGFYDRALLLRPDVSWPYYKLGELYKQREEWDQAIPYFIRAIEIKKEMLQAYFYLGEVYAKTGQMEKVPGLYQKAMQIYPNDPLWREEIYKAYQILMRDNHTDAAFYQEAVNKLKIKAKDEK